MWSVFFFSEGVEGEFFGEEENFFGEEEFFF